MASYLRDVTLLVTVLTVLLQEISTQENFTSFGTLVTQGVGSEISQPKCVNGKEYNTANINAPISESNCPESQCFVCKRGTKWGAPFAKVYSRKYNSTFLCDTLTEGGGWILIQRRVYRKTSFRRNWEEYKNGFGSICGDYWLGNENIYKITNTRHFELRVDMVFSSKKFYAQYKDFYIDGEDKNYTLHLGGFTKGNVRDDLLHHDSMQFSTPDRDNDVSPTRHCAKYYGSGWWFHDCHSSHLNGHFQESLRKYYGFSVIWSSVTGSYNELDSVEMKIRARQCPFNMKKLKLVISPIGLSARDRACPLFVLKV